MSLLGRAKRIAAAMDPRAGAILEFVEAGDELAAGLIRYYRGRGRRGLPKRIEVDRLLSKATQRRLRRSARLLDM